MDSLNDLNMGLAHMYRGSFLLGLPPIGAAPPKSAAAPSPATATAGTDHVAQPSAKDGDTEMLKALDAYATVANSGNGTAKAIQQARSSITTYAATRDVILFHEAPPAGFVKPTDAEAGKALIGAENDLAAALKDLTTTENSAAGRSVSQADAAYRSARLTLAAALIAGLVAALALAGAGGRLIRRQLFSLTHTIGRLAAGDLTTPPRSWGVTRSARWPWTSTTPCATCAP